MTPSSCTILIAESKFSDRARALLARAGRVIPFGSRKEFMRHLPDAHAIAAGLEVKFDRAMLARARALRVLGTRTTQLRHIDLDFCRERGIVVVNIRADSPVLKNTPSTAEEAMALILSLARRIPWAHASVIRGEWKRREYGGNELKGKTIGLIGFGRLGRMVARYAMAFGMHVAAYDPNVGAGEMKKLGVRRMALMPLLRRADVVSLHSVYNEKTKGMLGREHFAAMKRTAFFINTARGEITDETALCDALRGGAIAGAALDTLAGETPDGSHLKTHPLVAYARTHDNLIILPHLGGATIEATERTQIAIARMIVGALETVEKVFFVTKSSHFERDKEGRGERI